MEPTLLEIFSDGVPRTTRMLLEEFTKRTGKTYERKDFASRVRNFGRLKGLVKNQHFANADNENKFWWGLTKWFEGNEMRSQYIRNNSTLRNIAWEAAAITH